MSVIIVENLPDCMQGPNNPCKGYVEIDEQLRQCKQAIDAAKNCLVCAAIGDAFEICENTLKILEDVNK